jgi:PAS domain S-box-containing protein
MNTTILMGLVSNAALLLALIVVYEFSYILPKKWKTGIPILNGILIGLIGLAIMVFPFKFDTGIFFDTRSILISITALTFGPIQTIVASAILIAYRLLLGGAGFGMGVSLIITSALLGILWKRFLLSQNIKYRWFNIYLFGVIVHIFMLACAFTFPWPTSLHILREISIPVLLIYPVCTVLLSLLLLHQKERNESMIQVAEAEDRYKSLFHNSHAVMLLIDPKNGKIIDANLAAAGFYGWPLEMMKTMNISQINTLSAEDLKGLMNKTTLQSKKHFHFQHRRAFENAVDVEVFSGPIKLHGKNLLYSIVHDISERASLERAKNEMEAQLRQQQKLEAIGTLAGGVAHEINNPVNGIMNYAN